MEEKRFPKCFVCWAIRCKAIERLVKGKITLIVMHNSNTSTNV